MSECKKECGCSCSEDPIASAGWGSDQKLAVLWFIGAIILGSCLTMALRNTDRYNYAHNAEFYDYDAYKQNRLSSTSIASDNLDKRAQGDLNTIKSNLK